MAHTCPRCMQLCHCNGDIGDIDDIDFGESNKCTKDHDGCIRNDEDDYDEDDDPAYLGDRY